MVQKHNNYFFYQVYPECGIIEFPWASPLGILLYHRNGTVYTPEKAIVQLTCTMIKSTSSD